MGALTILSELVTGPVLKEQTSGKQTRVRPGGVCLHFRTHLDYCSLPLIVLLVGDCFFLKVLFFIEIFCVI